MQRQLCDIDTIVLSYIYNRPFEGKLNADVGQDEIEFDAPDSDHDTFSHPCLEVSFQKALTLFVQVL